jgi:exosome complex RNA-binding protein Rrp42 (RNase PH superfamily)
VIVTGDIAKPFPDRPTEGTLQFSADLCLAAEVSTLTLLSLLSLSLIHIL